MFVWLENTPIAIWVGVSLWGYPILLSLHAVGLAVVVGIFSMRDMRLLGVFRGIRPAAFLPLSKLASTGFIVNAISGVLLFTSQAVMFVNNVAFLLKIGFIIAGVVLARVIEAQLRGELAAADGDVVISGSTRLIALFSLSLWLAAIITGRLVAYT